ncbi:SPOR domain-containing protein [Polaromonas sp.]|uniref:SPOR domain-containing protein n=1 Tax=Polaromonas sp. TaxID=1869339 RepID=UPI001D78D853|nr:SPOR domain-containing protein [Polaromonas sp.]MBT9477211.1 SPOR domain-containing protein [Polaromonas sp.]
MSFFNFRRGGSNAAPPAASAVQTDSVEVMRKRAKHRLIGAALLVLMGVVGFPLLFDTQPRPIAVDIPIEIPGKNTVKPLALPAPAGSTATRKEIAPAEKVTADASLAPEEEILPSRPAAAPVERAPVAIKNDVKPGAKAEVRAVPKPPVEAEAKPAPPPPKAPVPDSEGARAKALLNAAPPPSAKAVVAETDARVVVQVGAFADVDKAREVRAKLERAGLKTYAQVADTKDGKRTRVRVGPFASRADAEKAAAKIKSLDLPAAILSL